MPNKAILKVYYVSIQLVSPASGEITNTNLSIAILMVSFHSISFPSEWGGAMAGEGAVDAC